MWLHQEAVRLKLCLHVLLWLFLAEAQLAQMQIEAEAALLEVTETAV